MRPVYRKRHRFNWKDLIRIGLVTLAYYAFIIGYALIILAIRWVLFKGSFMIMPNQYNWWIIYAVFIAPGINAVAHLIYSETGWLNYKAFIWIHSAIITIVIPVVVFTFFH